MGVNVMSDQYNQIGKIIGCTIADLRKNEGLTQKDFSKIFNVSESSIAHYEQGLTVPSAEMLMKFADYFGVSVDYLLREPTKATVIDPEQYVEIACKKDRNAWRCTVKNISDRELEQVKLKTFFYDKDGNSIDYRENLVFDLEPDTVKPELLYSTVGAKAASSNSVQ